MKRWQLFGGLGLLVAIAIPVTLWDRQRWLSQETARPAIALYPATKQAPSTAAVPVTLTAEEAAEIAAVIEQQMAAFQADDADLAFSFASPGIQEQFATAEQFMAMVKSAYKPVYRPQSTEFGDIELVRGRPVQAVTVLSPTGAWMTAYYQMEQQADKTWRIAGCVLVPIEGETI
ncbi:MAG: DUF4864 domain-containing protein [Cyanobacteria bacterium P01_D01_bin.71]